MNHYDFHEAANAFPYLSGEAYESLKKDILENGILEPLFLYEGKILDGRNRYRIAIDLGIDDFPVRDYEGDNPAAFVQSMNLHRRQLTPSQKAAAAAFLAEFKQGQPSCDEEYETQTEIAKKLGVSRRMVVEATSLKKKGDRELVEKVRNGDISLHNATALARLKPEDQKKIIHQGNDKVKEVAKKIKAMTKGQGRRKKNDPDRILDLHRIEDYSLAETQDSINEEHIEPSNKDTTLTVNNIQSGKERTPRKKKIEITEASDFGHSLIDSIIVLGATAKDANGGNVIDAALSESQLDLFKAEYDAAEIKALLSAGIRALSTLVKD
ncbi:ParB/RepB/Spo0J family partition protein [Cronobacter turicensis]